MQTHHAATLIDSLTALAVSRPHETAFRFLVNGEVDGPVEQLTWSELHRRARALGRMLSDEGLRGERAVLLYPPGLDYVTAFFGCLCGGVTAVPAYPPDPARLERTLPRLRALVRDCDARVALTLAPIESLASAMIGLAPELASLAWIATDTFRDVAEEVELASPLDPEGLAFLQYTSGSTGDPRGVMVRHRNIMANVEMISRAFGFPPGTVVVTWLPPYHDMGLIGGILQLVYSGVSGVLMAPMAFLQRPIRWLEAITRLGGEVRTIAGGPNFAYDLCARKATETDKARLDLSRWQLAFNGAEPVRHHTLERFAEVFAGCGFDPRAAFPCYGLAEVTLFASGGPRTELPRSLRVDEVALTRLQVLDAAEGYPVVSSGELARGEELRIVDPLTLRPAPPDTVGEIWIRGDHVAKGYWGRPDESARTFGATLAETGEGPFLRTGDLGFVRGGELFVTGRSKDVVVIRGRNLWPHDLERTVELAHDAVRPGCVVAFALADVKREGLGVVAEVQATDPAALEATARAIQRAIAAEHGVAVSDLALIPRGQLPKTSSGKVQRSATRASMANGELKILHRLGHGPTSAADASHPRPAGGPPPRPSLSIMFFSSEQSADGDPYALFLEAARRADALGFEAVWIPERHFHAFGAPVPNPATLAAALATATTRIGLRAGSVVMPLNDPIRVAESWAVVDRLSNGRVGVAFAAGWNPNDFALAPAAYEGRHTLMWEGIEAVRTLWRGEPITRDNGLGQPTEVRVFPRPTAEPPLWITCSGGEERFIEAGHGGFHVLTALLFQTPEELATKIAAYRHARASVGLDPAAGQVTVMLHAFVAAREEAVDSAVAEPLRRYLASSVDLWRQRAAALDTLSPSERDAVLAYAAKRYREHSALIGTPEACVEMLERVRDAGADEVACLIDFGVEPSRVLESLDLLASLRHGEPDERRVRAAELPPAPLSPRNLELRAEVQQIAEQALERPLPQGAQTALREVGLDSLLAVELSQALGDRLGLPVPATIWFDHPTIADVATELERLEAGGVRRLAGPDADLLTDAVLPDDIHPDGKPIALTCAPKCVLLTGVTGFLGAFLLHELLEQTTAEVVCLVRARDAEHGMARLRQTMAGYRLWRDELPSRVTILPGDLDQPRLGLDEAAFDALAERIDTIHHNGALVNFAYPYEACRAPNVLGTLEILRLACRGPRIVPVHYVSTIAVFSHAYAGTVVEPQDVPADHSRLDMGYSRSKWVAERLVMEARERGMPIAVYRVGLLTGSTQDGVSQLSNYVWNVIRVSIEIGILPDYDRVIDMVPVNWAARSIVRSSRTEGEHDAVLHLTNPRPTSIFKLRSWLEARGYPMRLIPFDRWQVDVMQRVCATPSLNALLPVLALAAADFYARRQVRYDSAVASAPFERAGDPCPPADDHLLDTSLRYFVEAGFIPAAGQRLGPEASVDQVLRAQRLHELVAEVTGVSELDGTAWRQPLEVLLDDMRQQSYQEGGLARATTRLTLALMRRARIVDAHRRHPEIGQIELAPPIFIVAPPRTGTTLLHNLLAADPEHRAFALWELMGPVTPVGAGERWSDQMIGVAREFVEETYERSPVLRTIHPLDPLLPDECQWLLSCEGTSLVNAIMAWAPRYVEWMLEADMTAAYRFHHRALQALQWRRPGGRLVCKDPWHLWHLDALRAVYPTSKVILIHRDMREVVPSLCSLTRELQRVEATPTDDATLGRFALELLARGVERAHAARSAAPEAFIDVDYRALVSDPIETVRGIYRALDRGLSAQAEAAMRAWLSSHPADKHGRHRYSLEMFGLTAEEVMARCSNLPALDALNER